MLNLFWELHQKIEKKQVQLLTLLLQTSRKSVFFSFFLHQTNPFFLQMYMYFGNVQNKCLVCVVRYVPLGEIASYHKRDQLSPFSLVPEGCASFGLSLAFPFCLLFDGSGHQSFIGFLCWPWATKKIFGIWVAQKKSALMCEIPRHKTHGFFFQFCDVAKLAIIRKNIQPNFAIDQI